MTAQPSDLPRLETRYGTLRLTAKRAAVIKLNTSHRTGDGPWIGSYSVVETFSGPFLGDAMARAILAAEKYAAAER